jgi:hypothetical protein
MVDPAVKCPECFELLKADVILRLTWADEIHTVTFLEVLQVSELINFLCKHVFRIKQTPVSIDYFCAEALLSVFERDFANVKTLQLHCFNDTSAELLRVSGKIICRISSDVEYFEDRNLTFGRSNCWESNRILPEEWMLPGRPDFRALRMDQ